MSFLVVEIRSHERVATCRELRKKNISSNGSGLFLPPGASGGAACGRTSPPLLRKLRIFRNFERGRPASEALAQIRAKGYADRFAATTKGLHLVGVSFSTSRRQVGEWREEVVAGSR